MFEDTNATRSPLTSQILRPFALAMFCLTVMAGASQSQASTPAEQYVGQVARGVLAAANAGSVAQFRSILRRHAELRTITKFALGRYARKLPSSRRGQFHTVVEGMITDAFSTYSARLRGQSVSVVSSTSSGKHGIVVTTKIIGGSGVQIKWRVARVGGGFRVMDLNVSGIWMSHRLRSMVAAKLKRNNKDFTAAFTTLK